QEPDTTGRKYVQIEVVSGARIWVWSSDGKTATPEDLQFTEEHNEWKRKYGVKEEKDPTLEQILWDNYMYHAECLRTGVNPETGEELTTLERMQSLSVVLSGVTTLASAAYWGHRWANTNINVNTRTIGNNTIKKNPTNSAGDSSGKNKQGYNRVDSSEKIKNSSNNSVDSKTTNNSTVSEKTGSSSSKNLIGDKGGGSGVNVVKSKTVISPNMKVKILEGQRKVPKNDLIGGHSSKINNVNNDFAVEVLSTNMDGTKNVIFTKQFPDGNISKLKKSTLFPDSWSNEQILNSIIEVGNTPAISTRLRDGATWHRAVVNGVEIDVIKIGDNVTSGYPTGTVNAPRPSGF
ncbi:EndoU nuclease, partial [Evansella caseinilytica]